MATNFPPDALFLALQHALAGRYSIERELGRGGMGIVYLARDVSLDRPVALKLLPPDRARVPETRAGFLREARLAARLAHPNIVPIHAVEEVGNFVFFAMRYVHGETLGDRIRRRGALAASDGARVIRDIAYALAYAHAQGVIHRDIKPDNILIEADSERAMVTDFGIAAPSSDGVAKGGRIVGTPDYVSPEQAVGEATDARSDLYSLGAVAFHCMAGQPPFFGDTAQLLAQHVTCPAPALLSVAPGTPRPYADAIDRALAKRPDDRFPDAESMADVFTPRAVGATDLPVSVRVWAERGREMKGAYMIWSLFFYGIGIMTLAATLSSGVIPLGALVFIAFCMANTALPWVGHGLWRVSETRKAIEAGATLADFRRVAALINNRRDEELHYERSRNVHILARLVRYGTYGSFATALAALFAGVFISTSYRMSANIFAVFGIATMATVAGALFGLIFPGRRLRPRDPWTRLRCWFWNGRLGEMMAKVSSLGLATQEPGYRVWQPTEVELGAATETLFASLADHHRAALADLPVIVARLEAQASRARQRIIEGAPGPWPMRLEASVAAIESLRLGLLRIGTGAGAGPITAELDAARELSERIDQLVAADAEVSQLLDASVPNHSNPQPDPSTRAAVTSLG